MGILRFGPSTAVATTSAVLLFAAVLAFQYGSVEFAQKTAGIFSNLSSFGTERLFSRLSVTDLKSLHPAKVEATQTANCNPGVSCIPGSKLKPGESVREFRQRWACLTSLNKSSWVLDPNPRLLPWPRSRWRGYCHAYPGYLGFTSNDDLVNGNYSVDNWPVADSLKFVWRPRDEAVCGKPVPSFTLLDGEATCQALRRTGGAFFVVGDSISEQFFESVINQLMMLTIGQAARPPTPACTEVGVKALMTSPKGQAPSTHSLCRNYLICGPSWKTPTTDALQMHFARSMFLQRLQYQYPEVDEIFPMWMRTYELPWAEEAVKWNASVVVLNRGAHFVPNDLGFIKQLNYTMHELRRMLPNALIVYRSTPPGHPNCTNYDGPISSPLQIDKWPYNWDKFEEQNQMSREIVESVGGVFFDAAPMTSLRPDWHVRGPKHDCLHHCLPGIVDEWVKVFAKMLEELV